MIQRTVRFGHADGLHSRPALALAEAVAHYAYRIWVERPDGSHAAVDDVMALMQLGVRYGETLIVWTDAEGSESLLDALVILISNNRPATA